jgi:molybdopterin converting factor small subunit
MIRIEVHMHGNLRRFLPEGVASVHLELPEGAAVSEVISRLGAQHEIWVASINNEAVPVSACLSDGVSLDFFPHIEGG